jgi:hypothetical protein
VVNLTPRQALLWGGLVSFVLGMVIGISMRPHPEPVRPQPRVTVTVTVTKEVPQPAQTVTKNAIPEHCKAVIDAALKSQQSIEAYEQQVGELPRLLDEAGSAIYTKDQAKLNELKQQSIKADGDSVQNLIDIREQQENLKNAAPKCAAEMKGN